MKKYASGGYIGPGQVMGKGYVTFPDREVKPEYMHRHDVNFKRKGYHEDYGCVAYRNNEWIVPGTYTETEPPPVISTMFGYPFDVDEWTICFNNKNHWYSADYLRMIAQVMDDTKREHFK